MVMTNNMNSICSLMEELKYDNFRMDFNNFSNFTTNHTNSMHYYDSDIL